MKNNQIADILFTNAAMVTIAIAEIICALTIVLGLYIGPVIATFTPSRGLHIGDLLAIFPMIIAIAAFTSLTHHNIQSLEYTAING